MLISSISDTFISIGIWIVSGIYKIASWAFEVFLVLATGQIVDSEKYTALVNNFYLLLGIILLFFLAFSLLKGMVNPDDQKQGTSTVKKIVINLVISAILMALLPTIFGFLYDFQTSFITKYNVIGRFFGYGSLSDTSGNYTNNVEIEQGAFQIVNGVYTAFFNVNKDECGNEISSSEDLFNCQNSIFAEESFWFARWRNSNSFAAAIQSVNETGEFNAYNDFSKNVEDGEIDFNFFLSLIAGLFLIYIAVSFCFDMALRMVKLVFYQIIAPIPIFARVIPEGPLSKSFDNWVKATLACYFEVYTRIFVFYFVVYLCVAMLGSDFINNQLYQFNPIIGLLGKAFLLMGMVMFMKQAPKLLSEVTGIKTDGMKLGIKDKFKDGGFFTAGAAVGALGAGITGSVKNATKAIGNVKNKWASSTKGKRASMITGGVLSTFAGGTSAFTRTLKGGWKSQSFADIKKATTQGINESVAARDKRASYLASHGGHILSIPKDENGKRHLFVSNENGKKRLNIDGTVAGRVSEAIHGIEEWAGLGINDEALNYYVKAAQSSKSFNDASEGTYKTSTEYQELNSKTKAASSSLSAFVVNNEQFKNYKKELDRIEELRNKSNLSQVENSELDLLNTKYYSNDSGKEFMRLYNDEKNLKDSLAQLRIDKSKTKVGGLAVTATKLAVDQKTNYSGDKIMSDSYLRRMQEEFGFVGTAQGTRLEKIKDSSGTEIEVSVGNYVDAKGNKLNARTSRIIDALISGNAVNMEDLDKDLAGSDNMIHIQDFIDKVNIDRQRLMNQEMAKNIAAKGNRPAENDKK